MKEVLEVLIEKRKLFHEYANYPDIHERDLYIEYKEGIQNGIKVVGSIVKIPLFSNHFYSPHEAANYLYKSFEKIFGIISNRFSKNKFICNLCNQGLVYNAMGLFEFHIQQAIKIMKLINYFQMKLLLSYLKPVTILKI